MTRGSRRNSARRCVILFSLLACLATAAPLAAADIVAVDASSLVRRRPVRQDPVRSWLRKNVIKLDSVDGTGPTIDLLPLAPWVAGVDIIGLGDGTHGTREYYLVKRRLIQFLAETGLARTVVFEGPWPEFLRIDDYVHGGSGDPGTLLRTEYFPFWENEEMIELIEWVREFNSSRTRSEQIELLGGDVVTADTRAAADEVVAFLQRVDPVVAAAATDSYQCVPDGIGSSSCGVSAEGVVTILEQNEATYSTASTPDEYRRALQSARVIESSSDFFRSSPDDRDAHRDEVFSEYLEWFSEVWTGDERLIVWAHNEHIGTLPAVGEWKSFGQYLDEVYGARYFTIGTCMLEGSLRRYGGTRSSVVEMQPPLPTNYELLFARAGYDTMIIPLFLPETPSWLTTPAHLRFGTAGYSPDLPEYHNPVYSLPDKFDAILFIRETSPTTELSSTKIGQRPVVTR